MKKLFFFAVGVMMVAIASSCNKYDYSEGELSTVTPRFIQRNTYEIAPAVTWSLQFHYVDTLDGFALSNGQTDTVQLVIDNPYAIPFSFAIDPAFPGGGISLLLMDDAFNTIDNNNITIVSDTILARVDPGPLSIGESKTVPFLVKHKDYLIHTCNYTAYRQF